MTFSAALNAATITADSFRVVHGGTVVDGSLNVDGASVTFTPNAQWHLAASIEVELTTVIADASGDALSAATNLSFAIRDGDWANPILVASNVNGFSTAVSNLAGDIVFPYEDAEDNIAVVTYNADTKSFAPSQIVGNQVRAFSRPRAVLNESGNAIVVWRGDLNVQPPIIGWSRFDGSSWGLGQVQSVTTPEFNVVTGLAEDGTAVRLTSASGNPRNALKGSRAHSTTWTSEALVETQSQVWAARASGAGVQVIMAPNGGGLLSKQFNPSTNTFGPATTIDAAGAVNFVSFSALGGGDMAFSWMRENVAVHQARYSASTNIWTGGKLGDGTGGSQVCENSAGVRIGVFRAGTTMLARRAEPGQDFGAAENLGNLNGMEYADCFLDESGNGHAFYGGFGNEPTNWARMKPDGSWSTPISLGNQSGANRGVLIDRFGNASIIYVEGTQAFALRYE